MEFKGVLATGKPAEETTVRKIKGINSQTGKRAVYPTAEALKPLDPTPRLFLMILPQVHLRKPCYDFYFL
jgi:hypothetical protein